MQGLHRHWFTDCRDWTAIVSSSRQICYGTTTTSLRLLNLNLYSIDSDGLSYCYYMRVIVRGFPVCSSFLKGKGLAFTRVWIWNTKTRLKRSSPENKVALDIQSHVTWIPLHLTRKWINEEFLNSSTYILGHNSVFLPNKRDTFCFFPGLHDSVIVGSNKNYLTSLSNWLAPVAKSVNSLWKRCWRASVDGWAGSTFHSRCDGKGPTLTIIRVGRYIFGGYTSKSWRRCAL